MTRLVVDPQHIDTWCDAIIELIEGHPARLDPRGDEMVPEKPGLRAMAHDLLQLYGAARADGHRRNSGAATSTPANVTHDFTNADGTIETLSVPQHSDRTGDTVTERLDHPAGDPIYRALNDVIQGLMTSMRTLEGAEAKGARAKPPVEQDAHANDIALYCSWHAQHGYTDELIDAKGRNGECGYCTEWGYLWKTGDRPTRRPPKAILDLRARGRLRISQSDIARLCGPGTTEQAKPKKRRRKK